MNLVTPLRLFTQFYSAVTGRACDWTVYSTYCKYLNEYVATSLTTPRGDRFYTCYVSAQYVGNT